MARGRRAESSGTLRQAKLSIVQKVVISLPLQDRQGQGIQAPLTRGRLDSMAQPLFKRMRQAVDKACWGVRTRLLCSPCALPWNLGSSAACPEGG